MPRALWYMGARDIDIVYFYDCSIELETVSTEVFFVLFFSSIIGNEKKNVSGVFFLSCGNVFFPKVVILIYVVYIYYSISYCIFLYN